LEPTPDCKLVFYGSKKVQKLVDTKGELVLKETGVSWLTLFAASGTLVCCALPIILVTLGMGATVVAFTSSFPMLITIAQHKAWVFAGSGALLLLSGWLTYRSGGSCPADPELARVCTQARIWNRRVYWVAGVIWSVGFFAAYLALPVRIWLDS
jgi:mercuric ion transport protein